MSHSEDILQIFQNNFFADFDSLASDEVVVKGTFQGKSREWGIFLLGARLLTFGNVTIIHTRPSVNLSKAPFKRQAESEKKRSSETNVSCGQEKGDCRCVPDYRAPDYCIPELLS